MFPPEETLDEIFSRVNNTGRWGDDDELGTLNYITPSKRVSVLGVVRHGQTVSIGRDLDTSASQANFDPARHTMRALSATGALSASDELTVAPHGYTMTHLDAVCHVYRGSDAYNGRSVGAVYRPEGLTFGSIYAQRDGIFTRGVLLDVAGALERPWLEPSDEIGVAQLLAAEAHSGVEIEGGDAIFVRTGLAVREKAQGLHNPAEQAGLMPECLLWLHDRKVAVYSGDCGEKIPTPYARRYSLPVHCIGLAAMGLAILDCPDMEVLLGACEKFGTCEFAFTCSPLRLRGGTGSPVNPLCLF